MLISVKFYEFRQQFISDINMSDIFVNKSIIYLVKMRSFSVDKSL